MANNETSEHPEPVDRDHQGAERDQDDFISHEEWDSTDFDEDGEPVEPEGYEELDFNPEPYEDHGYRPEVQDE